MKVNPQIFLLKIKRRMTLRKKATPKYLPFRTEQGMTLKEKENCPPLKHLPLNRTKYGKKEKRQLVQ